MLFRSKNMQINRFHTLLLFVFLWFPIEQASAVLKNDTLTTRILYHAFSHNDYWRTVPLQDALSHRFNCVEADLWLIEDQLYVAHDEPEADPDLLFESMYLKPLANRIQANNGKVYP